MIVCVMGPSGAGKSTLAKALERMRPDLFARVPVDFFFVPRRPEIPIREYLSQPCRYDWDALDAALAATGEERTTPEVDFDTWVRRAPHGGLPIAEAPIYLLDGMRPHPRCEFLVMVRLEESVQRRRLLERDARWGSSVAARPGRIRATFELGCGELTRPVDLDLDATDPIESNARRVAEALVGGSRRG